jgi:hypothetical protein
LLIEQRSLLPTFAGDLSAAGDAIGNPVAKELGHY